MTRKNAMANAGFGKGLNKAGQRRVEERKAKATEKDYIPEPEGVNSRSVLEQSSLDDLISTVQVRQEEYDDMYGNAEVMVDGPVLIELDGPLLEVEHKAAASREMMSIPRRPIWHEGMSVDELQRLESEAFLEWRRGLKEVERDGGLVMTPYERNLDFWRQLWRCIERSDLLVQVLDARDPDFYFCQDLYTYCSELSELGSVKRLLLLVNKADYLSKEQRQCWADYFEAKGIDALFFSALNEVMKQNPMHAKPHERSNECTTIPEESASVEAEDDEPVTVPTKSAFTAAASQSDVVGEAEVEAVDIAVPDSDDDLAEGDDAPAAKVPEAAAEAEAEAEASEGEQSSDDEGAAPNELLLDDGDDTVMDVSRLLDALRSRLPDKEGAEIDANDTSSSAGDKLQGVVGFVGYPNVGKSTVINALVGAKKVGMSRTPGKTKHIQTLQLPEWGFTLCDAPGLVFPSVVATRAHLVINNTMPLEDLVDVWQPIRIIVEKIGFVQILQRYKCGAYTKDAASRSGDHVLDEAHTFLAALSVSRNHFLRVGVPDENWAARKVLRDFCRGTLLYCEPPSGTAPDSTAFAPPPRREETVVEEEFDDLDDIEVDDSMSTIERKMTKRKERFLNKQLAKGITPVLSGAKAGNAKADGSHKRASGTHKPAKQNARSSCMG